MSSGNKRGRGDPQAAEVEILGSSSEATTSRSGRRVVAPILLDEVETPPKPQSKKARRENGTISRDSEVDTAQTPKKKGRAANALEWTYKEKMTISTLLLDDVISCFQIHGADQGYEYLASLHNRTPYCQKHGIVRTGGGIRSLFDKIRRNEEREGKSGSVDDVSLYTTEIKRFTEEITCLEVVKTKKKKAKHIKAFYESVGDAGAAKLANAQKIANAAAVVEVEETPKAPLVSDTDFVRAGGISYRICPVSDTVLEFIASRLAGGIQRVDGTPYIALNDDEDSLKEESAWFYLHGKQYLRIGLLDGCSIEGFAERYNVPVDNWAVLNGVVFVSAWERSTSHTSQMRIVPERGDVPVKVGSTSVPPSTTATVPAAASGLTNPAIPRVAPTAQSFTATNGTPSFQAGSIVHTQHARKTEAHKKLQKTAAAIARHGIGQAADNSGGAPMPSVASQLHQSPYPGSMYPPPPYPYPQYPAYPPYYPPPVHAYPPMFPGQGMMGSLGAPPNPTWPATHGPGLSGEEPGNIELAPVSSSQATLPASS